MGKQRLDTLLVELGLSASRERARGLILAGSVTVDGRVTDKAGFQTDPSATITILQKENPYVSRGGIKIEGALDHFVIEPDTKTCLDVGASTGGFSDCLLRRGAKKIYAVDVGYGQFDWKLRNDPRITLLERTNIRTITPDHIPEPIDLVVIDVSFISLKLVIPAIMPFLRDAGEILALIKPQFEVGKGQVGKGGVVRDPAKHAEVVSSLTGFAEEQGVEIIGTTASKLPGPKGNIEFFMYGRKGIP